MTTRLEYVNGINKGCICDNGKGKNREYLACTAVSSRWFKTLASAKDFMEKQGYKPMISEQSIADCEKDVAEIMQQSKERRKAFLPEKIEKLDEGIAAVKEVRAKFEPVKRREEMI